MFRFKISWDSSLPLPHMKKSILKVPQAGIRVALRSYPETRPLPLAISTRIPLELFELIIDFLNGDRETLKVCSSVSKAWLPCCRYHLFRRTLVSPANAFQLLALVNFSWSDPSIRFVSSIRHLVIQSQDDRSQHKLRFHNILHNFLSSSLISLEMTGASAFDGNGQLISHLRALPNLCRLTMGSFLFSSFRRFIEVICAPPNLEHLSLTGVEWGDSDTTDLLDIPTIFSLSPRLEYLEIFLSRLHQFLDWLLWTSDQAELSIKTLHVGGIGIEETAALSQFLGVLGPRLKHLKMYMRFWLDHSTLSYLDISRI